MLRRLQVESLELAERFASADAASQQRVAEQMVRQAVTGQQPPLVLPTDPAELAAMVSDLDASQDEADFRRARAATAVHLLQRAAYEDALYEALHAHQSITDAVQEALSTLD